MLDRRLVLFAAFGFAAWLAAPPSWAAEPAGAAQIIADNACAHLFVLGPPAAVDWRGRDLVEERPAITLRGQQFTGHGKNVLGDPRVALTWLANELRQLGITLKAGRIVTTGTCHTPLPIQRSWLVTPKGLALRPTGRRITLFCR